MMEGDQRRHESQTNGTIRQKQRETGAISVNDIRAAKQSPGPESPSAATVNNDNSAEQPSAGPQSLSAAKTFNHTCGGSPVQQIEIQKDTGQNGHDMHFLTSRLMPTRSRTSAPDSVPALQRTESAIKRSRQAIMSSPQHHGSVFRSMYVGASVEPRRKSIIKAESSLGKNEDASAGEPKRQRVRFFLPESKNAGRLGMRVWDPENSSVITKWNSILVIPMAYELWAGGFRLALGTPQHWFRWLDVVSDIFFLLDGLLQLNTGIRHKDQNENLVSDRKTSNLLITDRDAIFVNYFKNSFPFMLLPSTVYLAVTFLSDPAQPTGQGANLWFWWLSGLPRLIFRVLRMSRYFSAMKMNLRVKVSSLQLVQFILIIFMSAHWIGCLFFFSVRVQTSGVATWMDRMPAVFPAFQKGTAFEPSKVLEHYILCLYKGVDGLVSIGYVPVVPTTALEMILSLAVQYLSIVVTACILGSLFHYLLSQKDPFKEAHHKRMEDLQLFMNERRIPIATRKRLVDFFEFQYKKSVQRRSSALLKLPRSLEVKVANARLRPALEKCCQKGQGHDRGPFFGCSAQFLDAMVTKLRCVFLMPGDQFIRSNDMVLELSFVSSGYAEVMDGEIVKRIIRSDIDAPSIVGEVSFFLGVQQQHSVRAPMQSDIELLILNKEASEELFRDYPDQQETIKANLLAQLGLDSKGDDLENFGETVGDEDDQDAQAMRKTVKDVVKRRHDEAYQALAFAVTLGDLEEVRRLLRTGVGINDSNYDGKTVLHMAAVEGNYRVVELLLSEGAEVNKRDRWGNTALQDAINHKQGPVIQLLVQWKSEINREHAAGRLCDAASTGDLDTLKLILEHGIDPNCGDYDDRAPLHLAAAEGHDKCVEYLITKNAEVNIKDRWGSTPLQDAVASGHVGVAEHLISRGGTMNPQHGVSSMCSAAKEGDVRQLKILIRCGVHPDTGDYDNRCPMHLAAAEGRLLAVSYLLGVSGNPNCTDRWGGTPMDDCVRGGTHRHMQCAKLLMGWGGKFGALKDTPEGKEAMATLSSMDMEDVRQVVKSLIGQGLDSKKPERAPHHEVVIAYEACSELTVPVNDAKHVFNIVTNLLEQQMGDCKNLLDVATQSCKTVAKFADRVEAAYATKVGNTRQDALQEKAEEFERVALSDENPEMLDQFFDFEIDAATVALYDELDAILAGQERDKFGSRTVRNFIAKDFNRCLMNLFRVEEMWAILRKTFLECSTIQTLQQLKPQLTYNDIQSQRLHLDLRGVENLLAAFGMLVTDETHRQIYQEASQDGAQPVNPERLLVSSAIFQNLVLKEDSDDIEQLLYRSHVLQQLNFKAIRYLALQVRNVKLKKGQSIRLRERCLIAVAAGSIAATFDAVDPVSGEPHTADLGRNEVIGEAAFLFDIAKVVHVHAHSATDLVLLPSEALAVIFQAIPASIKTIAQLCVDECGTDRTNHIGGTAIEEYEACAIRSLLSASKKSNRTSYDQIAELQNLSKKDAKVQFRHESCLCLMDRLRETCRASWADYPGKSVYLLFLLWKYSFQSGGTAPEGKYRRRFNETAEQARRSTLRCGFAVIEKSWSLLTDGANSLYYSHLQTLKENLGEVGFQFFEVAFPSSTQEELKFEDWVTCWIRYLEHDGNEDQGALHDHRSKREKDENRQDVSPPQDNSRRHSDLGPTHTEHGDHVVSVQHVHWVLRTLDEMVKFTRHIPITLMLEDAETQEAYEACYITVVGNLKNALTRADAYGFLRLLLIDFKESITEYHLNEFMEMFSPDGPKGTSVTWMDIERGLHERSNKGPAPNRFFMNGFGSAFNPNSFVVQTWRSVQQIIACYYFLHVPVRITFNPYPSMTSWQYPPLVCDLISDIVVFCNVFISFNVSYRNKKSRWVIDRSKIARHYLSTDLSVDLLCALPLDWGAYGAGASDILASCIRIVKLAYVGVVFSDKEWRGGLIPTKHFTGQVSLFSKIFALLHLNTCILFLLGSKDPTDEFTWYHPPSSNIQDIDSVVSWPFTYDGYGRFLDTDNSPVYRVWKQYLLSFYWITTTVTSTGVLCDMLPKNYGELIFTIIILLINLTIFNYVVGIVSSNVLKGDEKLLKAREEIGQVESYINSFDFPDDLKMEIRRYFHGTATTTSLSAHEIFDSISQSLRLEMSSELTRKCLDECNLFHGCSSQLKDSIKGLLREVQFGGEELLFQINTVAHDMFFVMSGLVEQFSFDLEDSEIVDSKIGSGGTVGALTAYFGIRRMFSARAVPSSGPCLCLRLVRSQLMPILKAYPDDEEIVAQNAMMEFNKVRHEKSVNGQSVAGKSVKSARSASRSIKECNNWEEEEQVGDDASDITLHTCYEVKGIEKDEQDLNDTILSTMEQKLANLNRRRRAERIAAFCSAASRGEINKLQRGMRNGVHIDETDTNGRTALHCAASEGQLEAVRYLIKCDASIDIQDNLKNTPLNDAVRHKQDEVASELRKNGAAPLTLPGYEMGVQMCTMAHQGDIVGLSRLLQNRVDVNISDYDKRTALHLAAAMGHVCLAEFLLQNGAEVNCTDRIGFSPLVDAFRHEQVSIQKLLRSRGGKLVGMDVSVEMCNAAATGNLLRIKTFIENGANPNAQDYDSRTALHLAASNGEASVLDYLLFKSKEPINVNVIDRLGGTPLDDAYRHKRSVAIAILESAGGLRHNNMTLSKTEEKAKSDNEHLQRQLRQVKITNLVESSPENRACVWVRGRCGKLLPENLHELMDLSSNLVEELSNLMAAIDEWMPSTVPQPHDPRRNDDDALHFSLTTSQYKKLVMMSKDVSTTSQQWRFTAQNGMAVLSEELPNCRAVNIFSKKYKAEVEKILNTFSRTTKALQFLRFLILKVPQVRQLEDVEKRGQGGLVTSHIVKKFTDKLKRMSHRENNDDDAQEA